MIAAAARLIFAASDHVTGRNLRGDFHRIVTELKKTCLFVTHRIDDALELADRVLVLSAPAKIALERTIDAAQRQNPAFIASLHAEIAATMGGTDDEESQTESWSRQI